jgi:uncharacterized protein involved in exopolysaccharide biosynthesis
MVRAHLWLSIAIFVVLVGLAFVGIKKLPKSYEATAALIVNSDNTDPLAGRIQGLNQTYSYFPTQVELINNVVVLQPVVDRLKLQHDRHFNGGYVGDPKALNDIVVGNLRSSMRVAPGTGSQLLYISVMSRDPVQAAEISNAVADEYVHQTSQRTNAPNMERAGRYTAQVEELKQKRDEAQVKVAVFRERYGMTDLGQNVNMESAAMADLQGKLLQAEDERRRLEGLRSSPQPELGIGQEPQEALALRNKLDGLKSDMTTARMTMGLRNPKVELLQKQIDETQVELDASTARAKAKASELVNKYKSDLARERQQLLDRRTLQDQGEKLVSELRLAEEAYAAALRGKDAVMFASEGNYQDVEIVSRAQPPVRASKPAKLKLFAMAMALSMALALGGPFAYELLLNRRIRCRDDLEGHFRIVTLAQFGPMKPAPT